LEHCFLTLMDWCICPQTKTVNQKFYTDVLQCVQKDPQQKHPEKWHKGDWFFHHDKALFILHCAGIPVQKPHNCCPHSPYSPNLDLHDFFLFTMLGSVLKLKRYDDTTPSCSMKNHRPHPQSSKPELLQMFQTRAELLDLLYHAARNSQ